MPPLSENSESGEVWAEVALQGACTVHILLSSTRCVLKSLPLSVAVLALCSPHLKAQALRWAAARSSGSSQEPPARAAKARAQKRQKQEEAEVEEPSISNQAPAPAHRVLEILVESETEVPVVEACLRFAYDGAKALGKLAAQSLPQLLAVFERADYLGMGGCCQAMLEAAAKLKAWEVGLDDAVMAWNMGALPDNDHLQQLCTKALLHHFGDLLLVMRSEELRQTFMDLPLLAVLALLDSDDLATDSEDSVVADGHAEQAAGGPPAPAAA